MSTVRFAVESKLVIRIETSEIRFQDIPDARVTATVYCLLPVHAEISQDKVVIS